MFSLTTQQEFLSFWTDAVLVLKIWPETRPGPLSWSAIILQMICYQHTLYVILLPIGDQYDIHRKDS